MSDLEQAAAYLRVKKESKKIQNELAALDADLKKAGKDLVALGEWLKNGKARNAAWDVYADLISILPAKIKRYDELLSEKADIVNQLSKFTDL
jgi:hypothetical protein